MNAATSSSAVRQRRAAAALERMGTGLHDAQLLAVQCANAHHVASVFRTDEGDVVRTTVGRHSHGHRDRVGTPHKGTARERRIDFLDVAGPDDGLPAWCDCGSWTLSRADLASWLAAGERRVVLESRA